MKFKGFNEESKEIKDKKESFRRVAGRRVHNILNHMRLLRNCANTGNYSYTEEQVNKIFRVIDEEWRNVKSDFKKRKNKDKEFSL